MFFHDGDFAILTFDISLYFQHQKPKENMDRYTDGILR